ncbi:hypothetical protein IV01_15160 [Pseudomonas syringae]|uniref:Uncharacterized protein n=1 Tax=Pseudomonas syringae TaxID=317 RepID=A0A085VGX0_PSESX|nr:hypothetical protein IV01_15160 [Pseudomonas syringae]
MPCLISKINRIPLTIRISINPTLIKRAQTIRAVKPHQHRIKSTITIAQQIMPSNQIAMFAIKTQQTG